MKPMIKPLIAHEGHLPTVRKHTDGYLCRQALDKNLDFYSIFKIQQNTTNTCDHLARPQYGNAWKLLINIYPTRAP